VVLDHHKTAKKKLVGLDFVTFDMNKSGALLAWNYLFPKKKAPRLIRYVSDRDLFRLDLPNSLAINEVIQSNFIETINDFKTFKKLQAKLENQKGLKITIQDGKAILKAKEAMVRLSIRRGLHFLEIGGYRVPVVNTSTLETEIGNRLAESYPDCKFGATYYDIGNGIENWSLRSIGKFDVSQVALLFGGGGHKNAAGFRRAKNASLNPKLKSDI